MIFPKGEGLKSLKEARRKRRKRFREQMPTTRGRWWVEVTKEDGSMEKISPESNLIVANAKILLAALLKGDPTYPDGILYHAVGEGDPQWDTQGTPSPSYVQTTLVDECGRKVPTEIVYIDGVGDPTLTPTNIIRVKTIYETTDLPPAGLDLREHGLFGGDATVVADSGLMIDAINMSSLWKDNTVTLAFFIELEF